MLMFLPKNVVISNNFNLIFSQFMAFFEVKWGFLAQNYLKFLCYNVALCTAWVTHMSYYLRWIDLTTKQQCSARHRNTEYSTCLEICGAVQQPQQFMY